MVAVPQPLALFYSYAHEDEPLRNELEKHLSLLARQGVITGWHDREITAGREWENQISEHLEAAQIILLLISADFLASDYCYDKEMQRALERHNVKEAKVIPIILRSVDWKGASFSKLQALPRDGKAVTSWFNQDEAFTNIAEGIRKVAQTIEPSDSSHRLPPPPRSSRLLLWALLVVIGLGLPGGFIYSEWASRQRQFQEQKAHVFDSHNPELIGRQLKQLEQQAPHDPDVQIMLGGFYVAQNEIEKATRYYNNAIKLDPTAAVGVLRFRCALQQARCCRGSHEKS